MKHSGKQSNAFAVQTLCVAFLSLIEVWGSGKAPAEGVSLEALPRPGRWLSMITVYIRPDIMCALHQCRYYPADLNYSYSAPLFNQYPATMVISG